MSLVWHIVKKDARRMALPVGVWVAFVVVTTMGFRLATIDAHGNGPAEVMTWISMAEIWTRLLGIGQFVIGCLLVAAMMLEDGLKGTNAFWMTRPISSARLLAAKLAAAILLFVVTPTAALVPVWFASGLGWQGTMLAAGESASWLAVLILPAVTIASMAGSLAGFLFSFIGLLVGSVAALPAVFYLAGPYDTVAAGSWGSAVIAVGMPLAMVAVLVHQFLTRRTARSWLMVSLAVVVSVAVRLTTPWDLNVWKALTERGAKMRLEERPEDRGAEITAKLPPGVDRYGNVNHHLEVTAPWTGEHRYMPILALKDDGDVAIRMFNGFQEAAERVLGLREKNGPIIWYLAAPRNDKVALAGKLEIWSVRARILGEMPLREGGEFSNGAVRTRIVGLQRTGAQLDGILLEQHDAEVMGADRLSTEYWNTSRDRREWATYLDCYFLMERRIGRVQWLAPSDLGVKTVKMNSFTSATQRLSVGTSDSWAEATVVVVRLERDHAFTRPLAVERLTDEREEKKP